MDNCGHSNLKKKFSDPEIQEDAIDEQVISMIKEFRNQKAKFASQDHKDDDFTLVNNKKTKGKGKAKGKGGGDRPQGLDRSATQDSAASLVKGKGKGEQQHGNKSNINVKGKGRGKGAAFPGTPWTDTFAPVQAGFFLKDDKTPVKFIHSDDFTQEADGVMFFGDHGVTAGRARGPIPVGA